MKMRAVIEIETESYLEEQYILEQLPNSVWIYLGEKRVRFYIPYPEYDLVKKILKEWEERN